MIAILDFLQNITLFQTLARLALRLWTFLCSAQLSMKDKYSI